MTTAEQIQNQLERIGLASTKSDYGQGGGLDVDTDFEGEENEVKIDDSQEQTVFKADETLNALRNLPEGATVEEFWGAVKGLEVH